MKIGMYQPKYPLNYDETLSVMTDIQNTAKYVKDLDLLVFPEYSNCPGMNDIGAIQKHIQKYNDYFLKSLQNSAKNNGINIAVNLLLKENHEYFNTTLLIGRNGNILTKYHKTHLSFTEINNLHLKSGGSIVNIDLEGNNIAFATCFEIYFSEYFESLAALRPDIIILPSYQRSEDSQIILRQSSARSLDSEAFLIRSSYAMNTPKKGGHSLISDPFGEILINAKQKVGLFNIDINPKQKRKRPIAHGLDKMLSRDIIENFRKPSLYRASGPFIRELVTYKYPRVCAHRGLSKACPENTIPAFAAAVSSGAHEIEFDVQLTSDGHMVICHDPSIDRTTNYNGNIRTDIKTN